MRVSKPIFVLLLLAAAVVLVAATGLAVSLSRSESSPSPPAGAGKPGRQGCGPVVREPLDPRSALHVLAGSPEPAYTTDPPTSGPHQPGPLRSGVVSQPLSRPEQVGALEAGQVLVQHRELAKGEVDALGDLARLAGPSGASVVVVAPNPKLPDPVVITAWQTKQRCATVDPASIRAFVERYGGHPVG